MSGGSRQIGRIARLLGVDPTEVVGLDSLSEPELRRLHDQISHSLFADGHARFARVAGLSKTLPGPVAGKLAERFLPAVLAARVAELLEPARARDLVDRVSVRYLGDLSMVLDPVRSRPVVQAIPPGRIGEVAREIFRRGEYATMAEFVGTVELDALFAALGAATPRDLLAVVPLLEWNDNLDHVIRNLPAAQVEQIIAELDAAELAELALAIDPIRFGPIVHAVPIDTGAAIAAVLFERREYPALARFFEVVPVEMVHAALGMASGRDVLEVVPLLPDHADLHRVISALPAERIDAILVAVIEHELWEHGELLVRKLPPHTRGTSAEQGVRGVGGAPDRAAKGRRGGTAGRGGRRAAHPCLTAHGLTA